MRRIAVAVLAVVVALGLSASVMAQGTPPEKPKTTKLVGQLTKINGKLLNITTKAGDKSTDADAMVNDKTKITQEGNAQQPAPAKFEDLKVGQQVTVEIDADERALSIMIMKAAPGGAPASTTK